MQKQPAHISSFRPTPLLTIAAIAMLFAGCRGCDDGPIDQVNPDFVANPVALSFETCPSVDENGQPVADVFPVRQTFTLENVGRGGAPITFNITGAAAERFKLVEPPESLGALSSVDVTVEFTPVAQGDALATLEIDDGVEDTEIVRVTLVGTGTNLPAQPTMRVSYETAPGTNEFNECVEGVLCQVYFPDTFYGQDSQLKVKIRNLGCPALKVNSLDVERQNLGGGTNIAYFLDDPAVPPSAGNPTLLTIADGTQEMEAVLRFSPDDDGSGDGQRYAIFNIQTNSTQVFQQGDEPGLLKLSLLGLAAAPSVYASPSFCDFTEANDTCGGTKVTTSGNDKMAIFQITNGGNSPIVIESIRFAQPSSGRFTFGMQNPEGQTLQAGQSAPLQVNYTDANTYVIDHIDVVAKTQTGQEAGSARIRVSGGIQPALSTTPASELNFSGVTGNPAVMPLQICNGAGAGTLVLQSVQIIQGNQFFKLNSAPMAGTEVAGGACVNAEVQLTRPVSGGLQAGTLEIKSNDLNYAAGYRVTLLSDVPLDQLPVAVIEGPAGQSNAFSVSLSTLNPKRMTIVGSNSYDPPGTTTPVSEYEWYIGKKPNNAVATITEISSPMGPDIQGMRGNYPDVNINFDPMITGEYRIFLIVYDSAGQKSANTAELRILVNP